VSLSSVKKTVINVLTIVVTVGPWIAQAVGVINVPAAALISGVLATAGAILHYLAPNTTTNPQVAATQSVKLVDAKAA
jgi:hypothetical protein